MRGKEVAVRTAQLFLMALFVLPLAAQQKPRVWIAPNAAWRTHGNSYGQAEGEIENRTVELSADFSKTCKEVVINADFDKANYVVEINRRLKNAGLFDVQRTDVTVYRWNADLVGGASKSTLGAAVKAACEIMKKDWPEAPHDLRPRKEEKDKKPTNQITSLQQ